MPDAGRWARRFAERYELAPGTPLKRIWDAAASRGVHIRQLTVPGESGRTFRDADGWHIWLEEQSTYRRTRFTLAHEIAHFLLGEAGVKVPNEERWADAFASELLMPEKQSHELAERTGRCGLPAVSELVRVLSQEFAVTEACATVRLNNLRIRRAGCLSFRRFNTRWALYSTLCLPRDLAYALRSGTDTSAALTILARSGAGPTLTSLPMVVAGVSQNIDVDVVATSRTVLAYVQVAPLQANADIDRATRLTLARARLDARKVDLV